MNDILALLEGHCTKEGCEINKIFMKISGSGARAAAKLLYMRLVQYSTNAQKIQKWILKPDSFTRTSDIESWLKDTSSIGIASSDLLIYFKPSTYKETINFFVKEGLLSVDKFNRMYVNYPFGGKMLSMLYAATAIKSSYKKPIKQEEKKEPLDKMVKSGVSLDLSNLPKGDKSFWEIE